MILFYREVENTNAIVKYDKLVTFELHPFWKQAAKEALEGEHEKKENGDDTPELLVNSSKANITR
jgi:hypothetical protein